jgi:hypothetical protein
MLGLTTLRIALLDGDVEATSAMEAVSLTTRGDSSSTIFLGGENRAFAGKQRETKRRKNTL